MKNTIIIIVVLLIIVFGAYYVISKKNSSTSTNNTHTLESQTMPPATPSVSVSIQDLTFHPSTLTIKTGTQVLWTNNDTWLILSLPIPGIC